MTQTFITKDDVLSMANEVSRLLLANGASITESQESKIVTLLMNLSILVRDISYSADSDRLRFDSEVEAEVTFNDRRHLELLSSGMFDK